MTPAERVLAHFDRMSEAPDAIPGIRQFILDLAVSGRIVNQRIDEAQATCLLADIQAARGSHRRNAVAEASWRIPPSWMWVPLGVLLDSRDGERIPVSKEERSGRAKLHDYYGASGVIDKIDGYLFDKPLLLIGEDGANLVNRSTPIAFIARGKYWVNNHAHVLDGFSEELLSYVALYINAIDLKPYVTGTAQPKMNQSRMSQIPVALPPALEQRRILAKVGELMALCDQLEAAQQEREQRRDRVVMASLARLNQPTDASSFREYAEFHLDHLPRIVTTRAHLQQLRAAIRNLAVSGQLTPEHLHSVPAPEARVPDSLSAHAAWPIIALADLLSEDTRNGYSRRPDDALDGVPLLRISAATVRRDGTVAEEEHKLISGITPDARSAYGLRAGDLLACRFNGNKGSVGKLALFKDCLGLNPIYPDKLIRVRLNAAIAIPDFIQLASESDFVRRQVEAVCATTVGNWGISASNLKRIAFPTPSLPEQRYIVAMVNELMALCDQLEAQIDTASTERQRLLESLLHRALHTDSCLAPSPA